jgi:hypothetical protein
MAALSDPVFEAIAQALARGKNAVDAHRLAAEQFPDARFDVNGSSFADNARRRANRRDIQRRKRELIANAAAVAEVDLSWIILGLKKIAASRSKAADRTSAYGLLARILGYFAPSKIAHTDPTGEKPAGGVVYLIADHPLTEAEWEKKVGAGTE